VAVFFFSFAYRFLSFELTNDDYQFFTLGRQMAVYGEWPVRDLVEEGDPLHNVISAALQKTFGYSLFGEVMFDLWMLSAAAALVFVLAADISGSIPLAVLATLLSVLASPRLYDYLKAILPMVAFWLCFRYVDGPSRGKAMAMGLFTALAFLCRHDFGIFIGAASLVTIAAAQITAGSLRPGSFATYAGSALAGVLPYLVFVQLHVGVLSYIDTARQYVNRELSDAPDPRPAFAFDMSRQLWESNPPLDVNVRWAEGVSDELRATLERQYALLDGRKHEGRTWRYFLGDAAPANLRAIVTDPRVEDTSNIFRTIPTAGEPSVRDRVREVLLAPGVAVAPGILTRNNAIAWLYYVLRILPGLAAILLVAAVVRKQPLPAAGLPRALPLLVFCLLAAARRSDVSVGGARRVGPGHRHRVGLLYPRSIRRPHPSPPVPGGRILRRHRGASPDVCVCRCVCARRRGARAGVGHPRAEHACGNREPPHRRPRGLASARNLAVVRDRDEGSGGVPAGVHGATGSRVDLWLPSGTAVLQRPSIGGGSFGVGCRELDPSGRPAADVAGHEKGEHAPRVDRCPSMGTCITIRRVPARLPADRGLPARALSACGNHRFWVVHGPGVRRVGRRDSDSRWCVRTVLAAVLPVDAETLRRRDRGVAEESTQRKHAENGIVRLL
jgi:hypothetical protein